ncbi:M20/M25/M40 family metallo-hydrolase [Lentzea indica]|uniref:M20/M25/M40 family metallo-hydrolase n=1 Tax=Lentzea indica TaxID=2604800 RepID=UPI0028AF91AA|nr:M20/M25/M40 family metallo-hydrolase [Lentzea indica]
MIQADRDLLLRLLSLPTAGPLETTAEVHLWEAMEVFASAAAGIGFRVAHLAAPEPSVLRRPDVPSVLHDVGPEFLACQPSLVLRLGPAEPAVMFNVHLDTVAPFEPEGFDGTRFHGRGAIDAKGPAVAVLAGIRAAVAADPAVGHEAGVLIQAVSGEEGGAMGTFGTRPLVEAGFHGGLNIFCEPTGLRNLPRCTAAMTASVRVDGDDAIDDERIEATTPRCCSGFSPSTSPPVSPHSARSAWRACTPVSCTTGSTAAANCCSTWPTTARSRRGP